MADILVLVATTGPLGGTVVRVPEAEGLSIGRAPDNQLVIPDDGVSRYHARLLYDNGTLWVQDLGSRNGVFINDVRVTGHRALKVGDEASFSGHRFEVRWSEDAPSQEIQPALSDAPSAGVEDTTSEVTPSTQRKWYWPFG